MAFTEYQRKSLEQAPSALYAPPYLHPQPSGRPNVLLTALDRFEEQWRSSQGRVVPAENAMSPPRLDYQRIHSPIHNPGPPSPNAPFYVPRPYEAPNYQYHDRQERDGPPHREQICVQVNQAPRHPVVYPSSPTYQPWQRNPDLDRLSDHSRPPFDPYQSSHVARPATVPPPQYRQQSHPRHLRPESRSRRHPYAESRRARRSTSSHSKYPPKRRSTPPQHNQRPLPNRHSVI